eukprot:3870388-Karenia_brevis.AAC.1
MFLPASVCGVTHHHNYDPPLNRRHLAMLGVMPWTTNIYQHGLWELMLKTENTSQRFWNKPALLWCALQDNGDVREKDGIAKTIALGIAQSHNNRTAVFEWQP